MSSSSPPPPPPHDALSSGNSMIAVPKRATVADLVSSVVAAAAAQRETSSLSLINGASYSPLTVPAGGRHRRLVSSSTSSSSKAELPPEVVAKFPSHQGLWAVLRRAIAADPVGTQEPPLFLLRDSVTRDALTINQQYLKSLIESFELNGAVGDVGGGLRRALPPSTRRDHDNELDDLVANTYGDEYDGEAHEEFYDDDSATQQQQQDANGNSFAGSVSKASFDLRRSPAAGSSFARGFNESTLSTLGDKPQHRDELRRQEQHDTAATMAPRGNRTEPKSSLVTVTVTSSTGLLRTFRASVQFWEHVLLQYHIILESHRRWPSRSSPSAAENAGRTRAASETEREVEASNTLTAEQLLRKAKQQEDDRVVLTVKVSGIGSRRNGGGGGEQDASRTVAPPPAWWMSGASRTQPDSSTIGAPGVVTEGDVELLSSLQVTVKEWRDIVHNWDRTTEPLVVSSSRRMPPSSLRRGPGHEPSPLSSSPRVSLAAEYGRSSPRPPAADLEVVVDTAKASSDAAAPLAEGSRPRRSAVIDPNTSGDLVEEARRRMYDMEARQAGSGHSAFWTQFMKHWSVLEAQYRNYL